MTEQQHRSARRKNYLRTTYAQFDLIGLNRELAQLRLYIAQGCLDAYCTRAAIVRAIIRQRA